MADDRALAFDGQRVGTSRADPARLAIGSPGALGQAQVVLDRQLEMDRVRIVAKAVEYIDLAEGALAVTHRQVMRQQVSAGSVSQQEMPQRFVIQAQATGEAWAGHALENSGITLQVVQPGAPYAGVGQPELRQGRATGEGRAQQVRCLQQPGEIANLRMAQQVQVAMAVWRVIVRHAILSAGPRGSAGHVMFPSPGQAAATIDGQSVCPCPAQPA